MNNRHRQSRGACGGPARDRYRRNLYGPGPFRRADRRAQRRQVAEHAARPHTGRARHHRPGGARRRGGRLLRPWRDDGDQRDHRADRRQDRAGHHRGIPGRAGDRARQPPRSLQPALPQGGPLRAAAAALRGARAGGRQGPGPCAAASGGPGPRGRGVPGRGGGGDRHPVPPLLRRARPRSRVRGLSARAPARRRHHRLPRDHPRMARVRARQHGRAQRLCAAHRAALFRHARGRPRRPRPRLPQDGDAVERRHHELRLGQGAPDHAARIGPGGRGQRRRAHRPPVRRARRDLSRHRRHHRQVLHHRGRRAQDHHRLPAGSHAHPLRLPGAGAGDRHRGDRRGRRLHRLVRRVGRALRRPAQRRRRSGARLLRPRRRRAHRDRRQAHHRGAEPRRTSRAGGSRSTSGAPGRPWARWRKGWAAASTRRRSP